jgi:hypothetical protein
VSSQLTNSLGFEFVVSVVGNSIMRLQPAMIEAAIEGGVRHFYPSEFGSDVSQEVLRTFRYFRDKRVTRDHLAAKAKEHPDFYYTLMLTGIFTEWTADPFYNIDVVNHTANPYGWPGKPLHVTSIPEYVCPRAVLASIEFTETDQPMIIVLRDTPLSQSYYLSPPVFRSVTSE